MSDCEPVSPVTPYESMRSSTAESQGAAVAELPAIDVRLQEVPTLCACRARQYADRKPRPLFRGVLHALLGPALLAGAAAGFALGQYALALGLLLKAFTYCASAVFHVYPFASARGGAAHLTPRACVAFTPHSPHTSSDEHQPTPCAVTRAFALDLLCVPCSVCGALAPFVAPPSAADRWLPSDAAAVGREGVLAAAVLALNACAVLWQTRGQLGLRTPPGRSDTPRSVVVGAYSCWALAFVGLRAGFDGTWAVGDAPPMPPVSHRNGPPSTPAHPPQALLVLLLLSVALSLPVTKAHDEEPRLRGVPWHVEGVYGLHEDFHLALAGSDAAWLVLALRFAAGEVDHPIWPPY